MLSYGIQQATYVLYRLATSGGPAPATTLVPDDLRAGRAQLLIWEAFVSGKAKDRAADDPHISDARAAAMEFCRRWDAGRILSDLGPTRAISIAGLGLYVSGLTSDPAMLVVAPIVVIPPDFSPLGVP